MTEKEKQLIVQEVNLLRELRHPHIVRYHDRIIDKDKSILYIIMEYCEVQYHYNIIIIAVIEKTRPRDVHNKILPNPQI